MSALKIKSVRVEELRSKSDKNAKAKVVKNPVVLEGLKEKWTSLMQFVAVGGDFV